MACFDFDDGFVASINAEPFYKTRNMWDDEEPEYEHYADVFELYDCDWWFYQERKNLEETDLDRKVRAMGEQTKRRLQRRARREVELQQAAVSSMYCPIFLQYMLASESHRYHHTYDMGSMQQYKYDASQDRIWLKPHAKNVKMACGAIKQMAGKNELLFKELEETMKSFCNERMPDRQSKQAINTLFNILKSQLHRAFPQYKLRAYGGSHNGFGQKCSDLDLTLLRDENLSIMDVYDVLNQEDNKKESGLIDAELIQHTAVPVAKMVFRRSSQDIDVDFTINNHEGVENTRLLQKYSKIDKRVAQLYAVIKNWAKYNKMHGGKDKRFNSYSLVLLVINFLQKGVSPAVLPHLDGKNRLQDTVWTLQTRVAKLYSPSAKQPMTLPELVIGFMNYYAVFDNTEWYVDINCSYFRNRNQFKEPSFDGERIPLLIKCPVYGEHPTRNVSEECYTTFRGKINEFNKMVRETLQKYADINTGRQKFLEHLGIG
ncbi:unnamed protein product [Bursaphelenchus okinawaensis]|uniref:Poly(A) RNA polymerase mitochondrial-like central palm domain-containing protein n=1 Tax=Bursaphelenchus okinawaensis TaxID=465554 RepID=A0A811K1L8_9BILA|nr:unnamed protein product [Bursaphelenchus okinawaensis]CAG9090069.1 unnamed protein product [Bursaphelenchus okinawaensis]